MPSYVPLVTICPPESMLYTVLGLVGGAPGGETQRVADSSAAGAGRFFHNIVHPFLLASVLHALAD